MSLYLPKTYFLVAGCGEGPTPLNAFDAALLNAGVGNLNLVKVSSIIPPNCCKVEPLPLQPGSLIPIAYASKTSTLQGEIIAAGVAVGIPEEDDQAGVIMEYSAAGRRQEVEDIVREMAKLALEMRSLKIKSIESRSVETKIERNAAAFAGVVLI